MRKSFSICLVLLLLAIFLLPQKAFGDNSNTASRFSDLPENNWAYKYASLLEKRGMMEKDPEGKFNPDQPLTRAEVTKIILLEKGIPVNEEVTESGFSDVDLTNPYLPYIKKAFEEGILNGYPDGTFKPDGLVNRAEFIKIILQAHKQDTSNQATNEFSDVPKDAWFADYIGKALSLGLVKGADDGKFYPENSVTRAQAAKIICELMKKENTISENDLSFAAMSAESVQVKAYEEYVFAIINALRAENDLPPYALNPDISAVARKHAQYLADNNIKSEHAGENGSTPFKRLDDTGISYAYAAENVAWATSNQRSIMETLLQTHIDEKYGMMSEPPDKPNHRTNILSTFHNFNQVGIGVVIKNSNGSTEVRIVENFVQAIE